MESRIEELEIRYAHQDSALEALTAQVQAQERKIDELNARVSYLYAQLQTLSPSNIAPLSEETPPPHY